MYNPSPAEPCPCDLSCSRGGRRGSARRPDFWQTFHLQVLSSALIRLSSQIQRQFKCPRRLNGVHRWVYGGFLGREVGNGWDLRRSCSGRAPREQQATIEGEQFAQVRPSGFASGNTVLSTVCSSAGCSARSTTRESGWSSRIQSCLG